MELKQNDKEIHEFNICRRTHNPAGRLLKSPRPSVRPSEFSWNLTMSDCMINFGAIHFSLTNSNAKDHWQLASARTSTFVSLLCAGADPITLWNHTACYEI